MAPTIPLFNPRSFSDNLILISDDEDDQSRQVIDLSDDEGDVIMVEANDQIVVLSNDEAGEMISGDSGGAGIEVLGSVELNEFHETFTNLLFNLSH
jgi:hypothetical protein